MVHDEVHLSHPYLQTLLESAPHQSGPMREWYQGENSSQRHLDILEICLAVLTLPATSSSTQTLPSSDSIKKPAISLLETSEPYQLPYAVQHWARHYQLYKAESEGSIDDIENAVLKLLRDRSTRQRWQNTYNQLTNPFLRPGEQFQTPLPVAAHFGLDDLVEVFQTEFSQESSLALIEAARNGHLSSVRNILRSHTLSLTFDNAHLLQALMAAMAGGHGDIIRVILEYITNRNLDVEYPWPSQILCRAAFLGSEEVVKAILNLGAEADPVDIEDGGTPLYLAALGQQYATAKILLEARASVIAKSTNFGRTALHAAAAFGFQDIVGLLLEWGAEPEAKTTADMTPLQLACVWGHYAAVEVLLDHKRFQEYHDPAESRRDQPLLLAIKNGNVKTMDSLLRHHADPNVRDDLGTSLFHAVHKRRIDICHLLLAKDVDVNYVVRESHPALIAAVIARDIDIVNLLLDHEADIEQAEDNSVVGWQRTALHFAVGCNEKDIVRVLLERKADPNVRDSDGWTTLWAAARFGYAEIVKLLIDAKAEINCVCTPRAWSPLHAAYDSLEVVRVLLEHGADVNKSSESGTPLNVAAEHNKHEVVKLLLSSKNPRLDLTTESSQAALTTAVRLGYREIVNHMLEAGADVNTTDEVNGTLTGIAMSQDNEAIVRTIIEFNPDLDIRDTEGNAVLHNINSKTPLASVRLAVNAGARVNCVNKKGRTPLHKAIDFSTLEVVEYPISKNADVNSLGDLAPLLLAFEVKNLDMVKLLIESGANTNLPVSRIFGSPITTACLWALEDFDKTLEIIRLLVENGADVNLYGGTVGYAFLAASLSASAAIAQFLLEKGAIPDTGDEMGRKSVHLASYNSIATLDAIGAVPESFAVKDKCGRVALHYASASGQLDLIKHVFTRSGSAGIRIDEPDNDGWTPLLWATRATPVWTRENRSHNHLDVVNFLLEKGANPQACGKGTDKDWLPEEVAVYCMAAPQVVAAIQSRLTTQRKSPGHCKWGRAVDKYCDFCLLVNSHPGPMVRSH